MGFIDKIFGNYSQKELKRIDPIVQKVRKSGFFERKFFAGFVYIVLIDFIIY